MPKGIDYLLKFNTRGGKEEHIRLLERKRFLLIKNQIEKKKEIGDYKYQLGSFGPDPPQGAKDAANRLIQRNMDAIMRIIDHLEKIEQEIIRLKSLSE